MPAPLKLVSVGGRAEEISSLMQDQAQLFGGAEVKVGKVAGIQIFRFEATIPLEDKTLELSLYAAEGQSDFRGVYQTLTANAHGVIGFIPADLTRIEESMLVLGRLHSCFQERKKQGEELMFMLQYHWAMNANGQPHPEELDRALGLNPETMQRVFTEENTSNQAEATIALLERCLQAQAREVA